MVRPSNTEPFGDRRGWPQRGRTEITLGSYADGEASYEFNHIKKVLAARGGAAPSFDSPAFEGFLDWLEANPSVKWEMISDDKRPYTRDDLKDIFAHLRAGGVRAADIMQTFAFKDARRYLARAMRRGERHDVIVFTLKEHWERGQKLPSAGIP